LTLAIASLYGEDKPDQVSDCMSVVCVPNVFVVSLRNNSDENGDVALSSPDQSLTSERRTGIASTANPSVELSGFGLVCWFGLIVSF
jgi:hypothetical protein